VCSAQVTHLTLWSLWLSDFSLTFVERCDEWWVAYYTVFLSCLKIGNTSSLLFFLRSAFYDLTHIANIETVFNFQLNSYLSLPIRYFINNSKIKWNNSMRANNFSSILNKLKWIIHVYANRYQFVICIHFSDFRLLVLASN